MNSEHKQLYTMELNLCINCLARLSTEWSGNTLQYSIHLCPGCSKKNAKTPLHFVCVRSQLMRQNNLHQENN